RRGSQAPRLVEPAIASLDQALNALEEARIALQTALEEANFDPAELERLEERLFALRAASRKYDVMVEGLPALAERYAADLAALDEGEGQLKTLEEADRAARQAYEAEAATLSQKRQATASHLDKAVNGELGPLKLERARFSTNVDSDKTLASPDGFD